MVGAEEEVGGTEGITRIAQEGGAGVEGIRSKNIYAGSYGDTAQSEVSREKGLEPTCTTTCNDTINEPIYAFWSRTATRALPPKAHRAR